MYVLKIGALYVTNILDRPSSAQREARRFSSQERVQVSDDAVLVLYGPDARFVRLLAPGTFATRRRLTAIVSSPDSRD